MSKKQKVLGVTIDNVDAVEAMERVQEFMDSGALSTIGIITVNVLLETAKSEAYKEQVEQLDLSLIGDKEVLEAAGIDSPRRRMEVEDSWFLRTFIEYLIQEGKSLALIHEKESEKAEALKYFKKYYPQLHIVGAYVPDDEKEDGDSLVNLINGESPDVILAALSQPYQEAFMSENRTKLLAKIWIGVGKGRHVKRSSELKPKFWERILEKRKLKKTLSRYQDGKGE